MGHTVTVVMIADQYINISGKECNVHDIETIHVDRNGVIQDAYLVKNDRGGKWISKEGDNEHR